MQHSDWWRHLESELWSPPKTGTGIIQSAERQRAGTSHTDEQLETGLGIEYMKAYFWRGFPTLDISWQNGRRTIRSFECRAGQDQALDIFGQSNCRYSGLSLGTSSHLSTTIFLFTAPSEYSWWGSFIRGTNLDHTSTWFKIDTANSSSSSLITENNMVKFFPFRFPYPKPLNRTFSSSVSDWWKMFRIANDVGCQSHYSAFRFELGEMRMMSRNVATSPYSGQSFRAQP